MNDKPEVERGTNGVLGKPNGRTQRSKARKALSAKARCKATAQRKAKERQISRAAREVRRDKRKAGAKR